MDGPDGDLNIFPLTLPNGCLVGGVPRTVLGGVWLFLRPGDACTGRFFLSRRRF